MKPVNVEIKKVDGKWVIVISAIALAFIVTGLWMRSNEKVVEIKQEYVR